LKCIYCLENKDANAFSRDHVIPVSFGAFNKNLTLINTVCEVCNRELGRHLEYYLGKATYEGIMRYDFNIKAPKDLRGVVKRSALVIKVNEGKLKGAFATRAFNSSLEKITVIPVPQIGFKRRGVEGYDFYPLWELPSKDELDATVYDIDHPRGLMIIGCKHKDATKRLNQKGFNVKFGEDVYDCIDQSDWDLECETQWTIDDTVKRSIAKIAFNYLAFCQGSELVMSEKFNDIRNFIRWNKKPGYSFFEMDDRTILADEPQEGKSRLGHIITVNWASDNRSVIAQVALFNLIRYRVSLAKDFTILHRPFKIASGHFFNLTTRDILPLTSVDTRIISF
jgi:hypothetical protein